MKKTNMVKKALLLTGLLALAATQAYAAEAKTSWSSGLYATANIGQTRINDDDLNTLENLGASLDDTDTGYSVGLGYELNKYVAFETGYVNLGETNLSFGSGANTLTGSLKADAFYLGPKVSLPITDKFSVFGKIGLFNWDSDEIVSGSGLYAPYSGSTNDNGTDIYFGAGLAYDVTNTVSVKAEWVRFNFDGDSASDTDVDFISVGLVFKFGKLL